MLSLLLELTVYGLLAYGTVYYFGLEVDWQQRIILSKTSECQPGDRRERAGSVPNRTPSLGSFHFPSVLPVAEDGNPANCVAGDSLSGLGIACCPLEVCMYLKTMGRSPFQMRSDHPRPPCPQVDPGTRMAAEVLCRHPALHPGHCYSGLVLDQPSR